ncbi:MAG: acetylglutamate kinase [Gemmataceae bacterium]|nr:acetylglutamate kinase [Gemmataceae bacterium]
MEGIGQLLQTLPAWSARRGRRVVVKLGGSAMEDPAALASTIADIAWLAFAGQRVVVVHGGGKPIDRALAAAGIVPQKLDGRRITDDATLTVVVRVLGTEINGDVVARLNAAGASATGCPALLHGELLDARLGRVGRVTRVDTADLHAGPGIPVLPSLARDAVGNWLNVNADDAATAVAVAWQADELVFLTDTPGVLRDLADPASRIARITPADAAALTAGGIISGGMVPKVEGCLDAVRRGVGQVRILDGRVPHALLLDVLDGAAPGTELSAGKDK